jgi:hypothetical protein
MLDPRFVWLGAAVSLVAGAFAVAAIVQRRARPNRVTWFVWMIAGWIAFVAQVMQGVLLPAVLTGVVALIPTAMLITSLLAGQGMWWESWFDKVCLALALGLIPLWLMLGSGDVGIAMSIVVHALASIPPMGKVWREPASEPGVPYFAGVVNSSITLLTLQTFTFATAAFAVYFLTLCAVLAFLILVVPRLRAPRNNTGSPRPADSRPHVGDATAFAAAFAADYLSWDEEDPLRRGAALANYWPGPGAAGCATELAYHGWNGHGRQLADLVLPGSCTPTLTGATLVGVRVRVTVMRRRPRLDTAPPPSHNGAGRTDRGPAAGGLMAGVDTLFNGPVEAPTSVPVNVVANAPSLTTPYWEVADRRWCHISVHVALIAGQLKVVDFGDAAPPVAQAPVSGDRTDHVAPMA